MAASSPRTISGDRPGASGAGRRTGLRFALGAAVTMALALGFAARMPERDGLPALALCLALALEAGSRAGAALAARRHGGAVGFGGVASLLLALGRAPWVGGLVLAGVTLVQPSLFAPLACALAGLIAMGACARLALARTVLSLDAAEQPREPS